MPVKMRLQRHGKKSFAFFHIVVADSRAPRDGKFIEKLGTYNPNTNPATIDIAFDKAVDWLKKGAQPTDTVRAILSYKGVLYKKHLDRGVSKGALTQEEADKKFDQWLDSKSSKINTKRESLEKSAEAKKSAALAAEAEVDAKRIKALEDKKAAAEAAANPPVEEEAAAETTAEAGTEEAPVEAPAEEPTTEEGETKE